jgi:hypothetical protein
MKKLLPLFAILVTLLLNTSSASAYGGGGVTPPIYDNPHSQFIIECKTAKQKLPFNQEISFPQCKIVKNPDYKAYEKDFKQRLQDFLKRVREGGK